MSGLILVSNKRTLDSLISYRSNSINTSLGVPVLFGIASFSSQDLTTLSWRTYGKTTLTNIDYGTLIHKLITEYFQAKQQP